MDSTTESRNSYLTFNNHNTNNNNNLVHFFCEREFVDAKVMENLENYFSPMFSFFLRDGDDNTKVGKHMGSTGNFATRPVWSDKTGRKELKAFKTLENKNPTLLSQKTFSLLPENAPLLLFPLAFPSDVPLLPGQSLRTLSLLFQFI